MHNGFGQDKHVNVACSVEHPSKPIGTGYFDYVRAQANLITAVVEKNPNGDGTKYTEIREVDLKGSMTYNVTHKLSCLMPGQSLTLLRKVVEAHARGEPLV